MYTASTAVKTNLNRFLKAVLIAFGLFVVLGCVKYATDMRIASMSSDIVSVSGRDVQKQIQCMAKNIYWEAASEPFEGKVAVAQVTLNRMESGLFPSTICGVVYQKNVFYDKVVCQFSWFCEANNVTKAIQPKQYKESEEVAKMVMLEGMRLPMLKEAMYYHADYVNPKWNKPRITQIGRHIFYKQS
jgi:spore germination cell wall hydrolase CwlJ-like protein